MSEVKKPATYAEQITQLKKHGCVIADENFCMNVWRKLDITAYLLIFYHLKMMMEIIKSVQPLKECIIFMNLTESFVI